MNASDTLRPFRLAIVGAGGISRAHRAAAADLPHVHVGAVVDPDPTARDHAGDVPTFADVGALLADHTPDGVVLATPPSVRASVVRPLLEAGVAVLCEKPLARNPAEAAELVELAARFPGVATAVAYCHRFTPAVVEMKRMLDAGELGRLVRFENTFACWHPAMRTGWMSDPAVSGGGSFVDTGCHSLDLLRFLCKSVDEPVVAGAVFGHAWPERGDDTATVLLRLGTSNAAAVIQAGWTEAERFTVSLVGTKMTVGYDYTVPTALTLRPRNDPPGMREIEGNGVRFTRQLAAFVDHARGGGRGVLCSFDEARKVATLVDAAAGDSAG